MALILPRNWCLIFFRDPETKFDTSRLREVVAAAGLSATAGGEPITVQFGEGPKMKLSIARGKFLETMVRGLVGTQRKHKDLVAGCDAQIKIEIENLDEALDEMNTLIDLQASLQNATGGLMYNSWNQEFSAPAGE